MVVSRLKNGSRIALAKLNYIFNRYQEKIWLVGDGRSGTTWVADLINCNGQYRELFEPYHPKHNKRLKGYRLHPYIRAQENNTALTERIHDIFCGKVAGGRIDQNNKKFIYNGLLIKDIFSNLYIGWAQANIPGLKTVLLIRDPFAVAYSKMQLRDWLWMTEPKLFLEQDSLMEDHLEPYRALIEQNNDEFFVKQILIWSILNFVALRELDPTSTFVLFYEDLVSNPEQGLHELFQFLGNSKDSKTAVRLSSSPSRVSNLSRMNGATQNMPSQKNWKITVGEANFKDALEILESFNLKDLYFDSRSFDKRQELAGC